ncbi:MAG: hypothetical protein U1F43_04790 [Myxococcota bacterium]
MPRALLFALALVVAALGGCAELYPQTTTGWVVAVVIFGAILVPVIWLAWKNSKGPPKT